MLRSPDQFCFNQLPGFGVCRAWTVVLVLRLHQIATNKTKSLDELELYSKCPAIAVTIAPIMPPPSNDRGSEHYRRAHARDGINEMHPEVLNRRISSQESGEMEAAAEQAGLRVRLTFLEMFLALKTLLYSRENG